MSEFITVQGQLFMITIASGIAIGVFYDIIRIFRRVVAHSNFLINIEDGLFWIISSVFLFVILFRQNNGVIRGYVIIGVLIGLVLYFAIASHYIVNGVSKSINSIIDMIKKVIMLILKPFVFVIKFILKRFKGVYSIFRKLYKFILKQLKKIKKTVKMVIRKI
ncbi:spore cortex biosynthesis protein YabQ [Natranaerovirga pectinivora]|uniref:Spore cortex biosynthesis protein YabQ n=1 Tax=Natranaerovirga pectinivora TaxID=682400 RepID=A0A4R3MKR4_9FIRM|nr:spore cortex biosynthesis protein YabQ [Natranaerovirga pectinivora]TCT13050.1 spore cortex biosynthesis protein YabQ [Natranaerovirga pectinivora]